jgi:hypothetical protein
MCPNEAAENFFTNVGAAKLADAQAAELLAGHYYVKVRTATHPGGEIRGQVIRFDQLWLSH